MWEDYRNVFVGTTRVDVFAQRVLANGTVASGWPVNGLPLVQAPDIQGSPVVSADGTGGAYFSWHDEATLDIFLLRLTADGQVAPGWPASGLPVCTLPSRQGAPYLVEDGGGGVFVAWADFRDGPVAVYAQRVLPSGQIATGRPENGVRIVLDRFRRELLPDGAGGAYLSCATPGPSIDAGYYLQRFTGSGEIAPGWPEGGAPVCLAPDERAGLRMVADGAGGVLLAWYDYRDFPADDEIYLQRMRPDGTLFPGWPVDGMRVTDNSVFDSGPDLAPDGMGGAYVCWTRVTAGGGSDNREVVHYVTGLPALGPGWPEDGRELAGVTSSGSGRITEDGSGGAILAWHYGDGTLHALRFSADGPVPVLFSLVSAEAEPGLVRLTWFAADAASLTAAIERRSEASAWQWLAALSADGAGRLVYEDRDVVPGGRYAYRLAYRSGTENLYTTEAWVEVPLPVFALHGPQPNPVVGDFVVGFSLAGAEPARLELYDLTGRQVLMREVGSFGAGAHRVNLSDGLRLATGVYHLRLTQGGQRAAQRAIVVR